MSDDSKKVQRFLEDPAIERTGTQLGDVIKGVWDFFESKADEVPPETRPATPFVQPERAYSRFPRTIDTVGVPVHDKGMLFCDQCGKPQRSTAKFCKSCGAMVEP